jgi:hypothetical protein
MAQKWKQENSRHNLYSKPLPVHIALFYQDMIVRKQNRSHNIRAIYTSENKPRPK